MVSQAWDEVVALAELLEMPVATSLSGKSAIAENHPLAVGVVGTYAGDGSCNVVLRSDIALFVGLHGGSQSTNNWTVPPVGHSVIQIDIDPAQLGKNYPNKVSVLGDARVCLTRLPRPSKPSRTSSQDWVGCRGPPDRCCLVERATGVLQL